MMYPYQIDGIPDFQNIITKNNENIQSSKPCKKKRSLELINKYEIDKKLKININKDYLEIPINLKNKLKIN